MARVSRLSASPPLIIIGTCRLIPPHTDFGVLVPCVRRPEDRVELAVESPASVGGVLFGARAGVNAGILSAGVAQAREFVGQRAESVAIGFIGPLDLLSG
jgi:hypothetical protein